MTAAFSQRDQLNIRTKVFEAFDCQQLPAGRREDKKRAKLRRHVSETTDAFFDAVNSDNPPQSRDEAIRLTIGALGMLLAYLFPQYALAIKIAGWLWDFVHGGA